MILSVPTPAHHSHEALALVLLRLKLVDNLAHEHDESVVRREAGSCRDGALDEVHAETFVPSVNETFVPENQEF